MSSRIICVLPNVMVVWVCRYLEEHALSAYGIDQMLASMDTKDGAKSDEGSASHNPAEQMEQLAQANYQWEAYASRLVEEKSALEVQLSSIKALQNSEEVQSLRSELEEVRQGEVLLWLLDE